MSYEAIGYDTNGIRKGAQVEFHPGTDFWMMGARYGTVTRVGHDGENLRVKPDKMRASYLVHARNVRFLDAE